MPDASWKAFERRVARVFGGERRGPDYGGPRGGKSDIICEAWSPECKLLANVSWSHMQSAVAQAEANCEPGKAPVAILKKKRAQDRDALVVFRLSTFQDWFLGSVVSDDVEDE